MLYELSEILALGEEGGFAVPAFNVYNLETVLGVMHAAEQTGAPVIFQVYNRLFDTEQARYAAPIIREAIDQLKTPACFHLDHGAGLPEVVRALRWGATGVMLDASVLPFEQNVAATKQAVQLAGEVGVSVEGELGHVGSAKDPQATEFTSAENAARFVSETGVKALAVQVGTAHGHYRQAPVLGIERIAELHAATSAHLVLHGGSGVPDEQIAAAVKAGIRKINFATDLCCAFLEAARKVDPEVVALDLYMKEPIRAVTAFAVDRIRLLGADRA